ncbi:GYD domain-containing protein [Streptomyces sp. NPDC020681]|uniref:GYD domain-containing protein n=1 Tax=Streptomyces sp. NPDC020681 TaxID=3365083 RepID=UPI0037962930
MPKYLVKATLTVDGLKGLLKEGGTARREVVERLVQSLGGQVESMNWAFGGDDVYVMVDLPSNVSAAAMGLVTSAAGGVHTSTVVLLTPEEIDEAVRQKAEYRAPGD